MTMDDKALLYYKLTLWAFGSGELQSGTKQNLSARNKGLFDENKGYYKFFSKQNTGFIGFTSLKLKAFKGFARRPVNLNFYQSYLDSSRIRTPDRKLGMPTTLPCGNHI